MVQKQLHDAVDDSRHRVRRSLTTKHDVVTGNGELTQMQQLMTLVTEDVPMLHVISEQYSLFSDGSSSNGSVKDALNDAKDIIDITSISGCSSIECAAIVRQAGSQYICLTIFT